ncbi:molecular chaperone [Pseudomonas putida]|uniref:Molecular chaperone n=1 Tax=Pseudomonas putida TaxID=303 RepID=A0A4D6X5G5_PSEPU|nr:molecular chaperone [Pseudomonas putida]QCI11259.1 molecular chaperone [Pseudomonas putida]
MKLLRMLCLALAPCLAQAGPELNVGGLYDYLDDGKSTLLKRIRNGGDATAFVKVSVVELVYEGDGPPREVPLDGQAMTQRGLVVSPARLIVPARGMQAVRLLYRGQRDRERYYRLRFIPVLPETGDGFAVDDQQAQDYRDKLKAGVNLLAGYGTLLFVRPADTQYQTAVSRKAGALTVSNQGNSTVILDRFRQCQSRDELCETATKHHLLPGRSRQFQGEAAKVHQFELHEGGRRKAMALEG